MSFSAYTVDNSYFYVVQTGQPADPVQVGEGPTLQAALADLSPTPIQSVGRDNGERAGLEWALAQSEGAPNYEDLQFIGQGDELEEKLD